MRSIALTRNFPILLHGGSPKGAERIAACWAENRKVTQIAFKPNWTKHAKAAPFRRNDDMLSVMPAGLIVPRAPASPTRLIASVSRSGGSEETAPDRRFPADVVSPVWVLQHECGGSQGRKARRGRPFSA